VVDICIHAGRNRGKGEQKVWFGTWGEEYSQLGWTDVVPTRERTAERLFKTEPTKKEDKRDQGGSKGEVALSHEAPTFTCASAPSGDGGGGSRKGGKKRRVRRAPNG